LKKGTGWQLAEKGFEITLQYTGSLMDGTVFDTSRDKLTPYTFVFGSTGSRHIKGWEEAISTMKKGEKSLFTIAPEYGYGKSSVGSVPRIPPDATLQYEIEILDWIELRDISIAKDGSLMKKIIKDGEGYKSPKDDSKVTGMYY
jgi:FK506-binding protein 4/5